MPLVEKQPGSFVAKLGKEYNFATIIYPKVNVSRFVQIGEGAIIYPGVILTVNIKIGNHVIISGNCGIGHDTAIGDYSSVLWRRYFSEYNKIDECCFIGVGRGAV